MKLMTTPAILLALHFGLKTSTVMPILMRNAGKEKRDDRAAWCCQRRNSIFPTSDQGRLIDNASNHMM